MPRVSHRRGGREVSSCRATNAKRLAASQKDGFRNVVAENDGYVTVSVSVPEKVLFRAIADAFLVTFDPATWARAAR